MLDNTESAIRAAQMHRIPDGGGYWPALCEEATQRQEEEDAAKRIVTPEGFTAPLWLLIVLGLALLGVVAAALVHSDVLAPVLVYAMGAV